MNLTGGRTTLILNVCALIAAFAVSVEGTFIDYRVFGWVRPSVWLFAFAPAITMFLVRNKVFSIAFLSLYVALAIQMCFQAWSLYSGLYKDRGAKDPLGYLGIFFVFSLVCLAIYGAFVSLRYIAYLCADSSRRSKG
jgi:hypothetical protein